MICRERLGLQWFGQSFNIRDKCFMRSIEYISKSLVRCDLKNLGHMSSSPHVRDMHFNYDIQRVFISNKITLRPVQFNFVQFTIHLSRKTFMWHQTVKNDLSPKAPHCPANTFSTRCYDIIFSSSSISCRHLGWLILRDRNHLPNKCAVKVGNVSGIKCSWWVMAMEQLPAGCFLRFPSSSAL